MPSASAAPANAQTQHKSRLPYLPGLDGLRALAVVAVLLYHADLPVRGGFLGVEIFFALSGFLITALLADEWHHTGRVDLGAFWLRRTRRLVPALALVLVGTLIIAALLPAGETYGLGGDMLAAIGYVMNWHLVWSGQSYFDAGVRPSLVQHLWSLAVEEQFYLIWPLLFVAGARLLRPSALLAGTLLLALASAIGALLLFEPGADPSRIYYGTDTRASGVLLGAALAMVWAPWRTPAAARQGVGRALDGLGLVALLGLVLATLYLFDSHPLLYRGGLVLVALGTLLVVAAITHPKARLLPTLLSWQPLRWVGLRSYGIYLWHWPIFQVTRPFLDLPFDGPLLLAARVGAVLVLAELSYRLVELPVRNGAVGRLISGLRRLGTPGAQAAPLPVLRPLAEGSAAFRSATYPPVANMFQINRWNFASPLNASGGSTHSGPGTPGSGGPPISPWRWLSLVLVSAIVLSSAACASLGAPASGIPTAAVLALTPTPAPLVTPTTRAASANTAQAERTPVVAPSATSVPTETASPTATATPEPSATPSPVAPRDATATAEAALPPVEPELAAALQAVLDRALADGYIPGAVVAVNVPGRQTWLGASGLADRAQQTPMTPETRVRIASISKIFTAVVVMKLAEEGKLSIDDALSKWVPDLVPNSDQIRVRDLLQHTTGLYDYLEDRNYANMAYQQPDRSFAPAELVKYAIQNPSAFRPGAEGRWDYSSTNYVILGMVVEAVTGNSLASEMRSRIFEPLGLTATFFAPDEVIEGPFASGSSRSTPQRNVAMSFAYATANVVSTAEDVQTFGRALFAGELVSAASRDAMLTMVSGKGQYNMPELGYGFGVMRNVLPVGRGAEIGTVYGHIGGFGGFRSALWHAPESGITIALGVNQGSTDPNLLATAMFDTVLDGLGR